MLKFLSQKYGIPLVTLVCFSLAGLIGFWLIMGMATYSALVTRWPEIPFALALSLSVLLPPLFVLCVAVYGAIHDKRACRGGAAKKD